MACNSYEKFLDAEYGKKRTAERDKFDNEAEAFCLAECIKEQRCL